MILRAHILFQHRLLDIKRDLVVCIDWILTINRATAFKLNIPVHMGCGIREYSTCPYFLKGGNAKGKIKYSRIEQVCIYIHQIGDKIKTGPGQYGKKKKPKNGVFLTCFRVFKKKVIGKFDIVTEFVENIVGYVSIFLSTF